MGLCLHYGNDIDGLDKVFVLGILGGREPSLIRLAAQLFDRRLEIRICTKVRRAEADSGFNANSPKSCSIPDSSSTDAGVQRCPSPAVFGSD